MVNNTFARALTSAGVGSRLD